MTPPPEHLALLYDGDSYVLELDSTLPTIRLLSIIRYDNNTNVSGVSLSFRDLSSQCKQAIIRQINRRYPTRTVKVQ